MKNTMTKRMTLAAIGMTTAIALGAQAEERSPNYAEATGKDWLYNHAIADKRYGGDAANDTGVDLFYVYPTLVGDEKSVIDGFRGIDDETMRGDTVPAKNTAAGAFHGNARCFADMTHVYAPYYRQATLATAMDCATNGLGGVRSDANQRYLKALYDGPAYADVTNALETYFANWNNGRKFMLAGHSQGSAVLRLVMENYFMQDGSHRQYLNNLVASYQIGFGVSRAEVDKITAATGVKFASTSNDVRVIVSYNLFGPGAKGDSVLLPSDAIAINPLTWTTNATPADRSLNLGALTNEAPERIVAGLYGATVNAERGVVECAEQPASNYVAAAVFGEKSLHGQDYPAFWENVRQNGWIRYMGVSGLKKVDTNQVVSVAGTTWKVEVKGEGEQWSEAVKSPVDGNYYVSGSDPADSVRLAYALDDPMSGKRFANGETTTFFPMACDGSVWSTTATESEIKAATKTGDRPTVQLGVVAQRYPWNGTLDVQYKTLYANASVTVAFHANGEKIGTAQGTGGRPATASFDLNAIDAFKDKRLKSVKITATIE